MMTKQDLVIALSCVGLLAVLGVGLHALSKADVPVVTGEARCCRVLTAAQKLGARIMSVVDAALARFSAFVTGVLAQVKAAKDTNDEQTAKLAELQAALTVAQSDDAADKALITTLQNEVASLQTRVADQINAAVDALENPPAAEVVEEVVPEVEESAPVVEEVVEEVSVVEDAEVPVAEEAPVVVEEAVVVDPVEPTGDQPVE